MSKPRCWLASRKLSSTGKTVRLTRSDDIKLQQHAIQLQDSKANHRSQGCHLHDYRIQVSSLYSSMALKGQMLMLFSNCMTSSLPFVAAKWQM